MNIKNIFRGDLAYQILYKLKSGISISISLTFKCNYDCYYCSMKIGSGKPRNAKEVSLQEWKNFINNFPIKLKEVFVSGGEPTLMPYCSELVNFLTKKKILVTVFTNLSSPEIIRKMKSCKYLRIEASLHPEMTVSHFNKYIKYLKSNNYVIIADEVGYQRNPGKTRLKHMDTTIEEQKNEKIKRLRIAPDMEIKLSCYDLFNT